MCPRYNRQTGEVDTHHVANTQLYIDDIRQILPPNFVAQLWRVIYAGNYGDPIVARDLIPSVRYFNECRPGMRVEINTNGSARPVKWWKELAGAIDEGGVWFGLDGLADTNAIYRRNTKWDIIMRNVEAFLEAGGEAHWNFLVFGHNQHQVEEARALAKSLGFTSFNVKMTGRFRNESFPVIVKGEHLYDLLPTTQEEYDRSFMPKRIVEPPKGRRKRTPLPPKTKFRDKPIDENYVPEIPEGSVPAPEHVTKVAKPAPSIAEIEAQLREQGIIVDPSAPPKPKRPWDRPWMKGEVPKINCIVKTDKTVYVSARGYVAPCCWISNAHLGRDMGDEFDDMVDGRKHDIRDIIDGEFFDVVEKSWEHATIRRCLHICQENPEEQKPGDKKKRHGPDAVLYERFDEAKNT